MKAVKILVTENDVAVDGSLAVTPSDMLRMTLEGRAICSQAMSGVAYYDAGTVGYGDVPIENRRGSSMDDCWMGSVAANRKIKDTEKKLQKYV